MPTDPDNTPDSATVTAPDQAAAGAAAAPPAAPRVAPHNFRNFDRRGGRDAAPTGHDNLEMPLHWAVPRSNPMRVMFAAMLIVKISARNKLAARIENHVAKTKTWLRN